MTKLETALKELDKTYGTGTVIAGNQKPDIIPSFSTGSMSLDIATGIGGWPEGRVIEIIGHESAGKCLDKDAYILTANGYKTVEEIFEEEHLPMYCSNKELPICYPLINKDKEPEVTTHFTYNGRRKTWKIRTQTGFEFIRTYKHPILTMSTQGNLIWKWAGELEKGDFIVRKPGEVFGNRNLDVQYAYALGCMVADGGFYKNRLAFTNDDDTVKEFIPVMEEMMGVAPKIYKKTEENNTHDYHFNSVEGIDTLCEVYGFKKGVAKDKNIPKYIREGNRETLIHFLRGYFDCESSIGERGIEVASASWELLYQVKLLLSQFAITSFLSEKNVKHYEHNHYWRLCLYASSTTVFIEKIGATSIKVQESYNKWLTQRESIIQTQTNAWCIPHVEGIVNDIHRQSACRKEAINKIIEDLKKANFTPYKLKVLGEHIEDKDNRLYQYLLDLAQYEYERVEECTYYDNIPTYDFAMERTHTFEADGFINHNTTVALHSIAEAQKAGKKVAFIDMEHAIDMGYARSLGVDVDNLLFSQPDFGEQALEITNKLAQTGEVGLIVVDSVASLVPKSEVEGGVDTVGIGKQARMMSQSLRTLTPAAGKGNTTILFLNQFRMKIGVMHGNPETPAGGEALKYYASMRVEVRRTLDIANQRNETRFKVIKNKCAVPFRAGTFFIEWGKGIIRNGEVLTIGSELGIIKKAGSWYSYEETKFQGEDKFIDFLNDNPELAAFLESEIISRLKTVA